MLGVLCETPVATEPSKGPLDHPAPGQDLEALSRVGKLDDLDIPSPGLAQYLAKLVVTIATIGEEMPEAKVAADDFGQHERCTITVLDIDGVDHGLNMIATVDGDDVTFAALDFLSRIVAPRATALSGLDALAVDYPGARRSFAPHDLAGDQQQDAKEREPPTIVAS